MRNIQTNSNEFGIKEPNRARNLAIANIYVILQRLQRKKTTRCAFFLSNRAIFNALEWL